MTRGVIAAICVGLGLVAAAAASSPVSLKLHEGNNTWIHVNFYEDDFLNFHICMWASTSLTCTADLTRDLKHPNEANDMRVLSLDKPELLRTSRAYSNVFACNISLYEKQLSCKRLLANSSFCGPHVQTDYFHFLNESAESFRCVGIRFSHINESLLYDSTSDGIEICNISCNATIGNQPNLHTLPSHQPSWNTSTDSTLWNNTTDDHKHPSKEPFHHRKEDDDDKDHFRDKTHIIIAAVVSVVVMAGLIIAGFVFRRQILGMRRQQNTNEDYVSRNHTTEKTHNKIGNSQEKVPSTNNHTEESTDHNLSNV